MLLTFWKTLYLKYNKKQVFWLNIIINLKYKVRSAFISNTYKACLMILYVDISENHQIHDSDSNILIWFHWCNHFNNNVEHINKNLNDLSCFLKKNYLCTFSPAHKTCITHSAYKQSELHMPRSLNKIFCFDFRFFTQCSYFTNGFVPNTLTHTLLHKCTYFVEKRPVKLCALCCLLFLFSSDTLMLIHILSQHCQRLRVKTIFTILCIVTKDETICLPDYMYFSHKICSSTLHKSNILYVCMYVQYV